ncbi:hypothetical protein PVK06_040772 [Gossypium arboreum]|uniref:RNase H type-1 domain-containing protein n=1 Tax=Gossypium arboreum TaxID=29729 RepID=A0ABR0N6C8_GOSAR|nr:hypothetical protein PVK06_040772 [Gossypium arboreum]
MTVSCDSLPNEVWRSSKLGFIKLNFDATFQSNSKTSSTAALARDSEGKVVGAETYLFTDVVDAFVAEAKACERTLFFASRMGFRCLEVEGDSLTVIKKLKAKEEDKSVLRSIISHIRMLENILNKCSTYPFPVGIMERPTLWLWKVGEDGFLVFGSMVFLTRY